MTDSRNVLVIAPDAQLRRSIAFLLEAEGYHVTHHDGMPADGGPPAGCAVVDEAAVTDGPDFWDRLAHIACAIVMLSSGRKALPVHSLVQSVEKPLLGQRLVEAVHAAFRGSGGPPK